VAVLLVENSAMTVSIETLKLSCTINWKKGTLQL